MLGHVTESEYFDKCQLELQTGEHIDVIQK